MKYKSLALHIFHKLSCFHKDYYWQHHYGDCATCQYWERPMVDIVKGWFR